MEQIARRYFHHAEIEEIFALDAAARDEAFLRCWTAKEAVLKAIGTGLAGSLTTFRVPVVADNGAWVNVPSAKGAASDKCWVQYLAPCEGYEGAVALVGKRIGIERYTFQW
jgi:4'-phosphopantetheinyl transferase